MGKHGQASIDILSRAWKELTAALGVGVGVLLAVFSWWDKLSPPMFALVLMICLAIASAYVIFRRVPSALPNAPPVLLFQSATRSAALCLLGGDLCVLAFIWPFYLFEQLNTPIIDSIEPSMLVAGGRAILTGRNFPVDRVKLEVAFGATSVEQYYRIEPTRLEIQIPNDAVSGPVSVFRHGESFFSPTLQSAAPWVYIAASSEIVRLVEEGIRPHEMSATVLFSIRNTTANLNVVVYDVSLRVLVFHQSDLLNEAWPPRIDLGIVSVVDPPGVKAHAMMNQEVVGRKIGLFGENLTVPLKPGGTASFRLEVTGQQGSFDEREVRAVFMISVLYHDDEGRKRVSHSEMVYLLQEDPENKLFSLVRQDWTQQKWKQFLGRTARRHRWFVFPDR